MKAFKIVYRGGEDEIIEKKSRFIATVRPVKSEEEASAFIAEIKKKYWNATHNCFAYVIGERRECVRCSDDGEPSGTAGAPMLNILNKNGFANVLIVVTRYFGGTLLGTGGLIRAYSEATLKVINESKIVKQKMGYEMKVVIPYKELEKFKYYCNKKNIYIKNLIYESNIICVVEINNEEKENLISKSQKEIEILESTVLMEKYIRVNNE